MSKTIHRIVISSALYASCASSVYAYTWDYYDLFGIYENLGRNAPLRFNGAVNSTTGTLYHTTINPAHVQAGLDDIVFYNSDAANQPNLVHYLINDVTSQIGSLAYIHTNKLTIEDIKVSSEDTRFYFDKSNSTMQLNLNNGTLDLAQVPIFLSSNPLEINVGSTAYGSTSTLRRFTADISSPTTITLDPNTTLKILDTGDTNSADYLRFRESAQVNVNSGSEFIVDSSKVVFDKGSINVDAGTVSAQGTNSYLKTYNMTLEDGSNLNVGSSTSLVNVTNALTLNNSSINTTGKVEANDIFIIGTSTMSGSGSVSAKYTQPYQAAFTLNLDDVTFKAGSFLDNYGSTININNTAVFEIPSTGSLYMDGTTINVNYGAFLFNGGLGVKDKGTINLTANGYMTLGANATLAIDSANHTTVNTASGSDIIVYGSLTGKGYIGVAGSEIDIKSYNDHGTKINGYISPGFDTYFDSSNRIGTLTTDANLFTFGALGYPPYITSQADIDYWKNDGYSGGIYTVDIDPNHTQTSDKIVYGAGNVDLTFAEHILVQTPNSSLTADDLHQEEFTVIEALNSGVAGTLLTGYNSYDPNDIVVQQDGSIPALIGFTVIDNSTNSKPDVTLLAEKNILNLQKKTDSSRVNLVGSTNLLTNVFNSSTSTSITSALNTVTNAQLASSLTSIHPEPYSSYMNVSLEEVDWVMSNVMAKTYDHLSDDKNFWADASFTEGKVIGKDSLGDYNYSINSLLVGSDIYRSTDVGSGFYFGITEQKMDEHDSAIQDFSSKNFHLGLYHYDQRFKDFVITGSAGASYNQHKTSRYTYLGSYSGTQTAEFEGHSIYSSIELSHTGYEINDIRLRPSVGLNYGYVKQSNVHEQGNDLRLNIDANTAEMLVSRVGLDIDFQPLAAYPKIMPVASVKYEHDWEADRLDAHEMTGALGIAPDYKDNFVGQNRGADHLTFSLGVKSVAAENLTLNAGVLHSSSEHGQENSLHFSMMYKL